MASQVVVVVGSGLAAMATARSLMDRGCRVQLVEEAEPVTAGPSTEVECYRPWWPGDEATTRLATRGVGLLEGFHGASGGAFDMNRRGQLIVATAPEEASRLRTAAGRYAAAGGGPLRDHASPAWYLPAPPGGIQGVPGGLDWLEGPALLGTMPFLSGSALAGLMVRRAGWVDGRALRRWLLGTIRAGGATVVTDSLVGASRSGAEGGWLVSLASGQKVPADGLVLAGARARSLARRISIDLGLIGGTRVTAVLSGSAPHLGNSAPIVTVHSGTDAGTAPDIRADGADLRIEHLLAGEAPAGTDAGALGESLLLRLAVAIPCLRTHRGPTGRLVVGLTSVGLGPDRRPVAGAIDRHRCFVLTGLAPDLGVTFGAADLVADYVIGERLPPEAPAVGPNRPTSPIDF